MTNLKALSLILVKSDVKTWISKKKWDAIKSLPNKSVEEINRQLKLKPKTFNKNL